MLEYDIKAFVTVLQKRGSHATHVFFQSHVHGDRSGQLLEQYRGDNRWEVSDCVHMHSELNAQSRSQACRRFTRTGCRDLTEDCFCRHAHAMHDAYFRELHPKVITRDRKRGEDCRFVV